MKFDATKALLLIISLSFVTFAVRKPPHLVFPNDAMVVNVKTMGAKGDGVTDDTKILQDAFNASCSPPASPMKVVYIPKGTYMVTKSLIVNYGGGGNGIGPFVYGEQRDSVIIKLDDAAPDTGSVIRCFSTLPGSADWFMRTFHNFTVNIGNNPGVSGINFFSDNAGILKNIRIIGNKVGKYGIVSENAYNGPNLIQDVEIDGFDFGIYSSWLWGQTLSRVTIRDCDSMGLRVSANVLAAESLVVTNCRIGMEITFPPNEQQWCGLVTLINSSFTTTSSTECGILNRGVIFARNVKTQGYAQALRGILWDGTREFAGPTIPLYSTHKDTILFPYTPSRSLDLPIKSEPEVPWETDLAKWVCVNDFGAKAGDNVDDTKAFQDAIDKAAAAGKTTVYVRGAAGDPLYNINGTVLVKGSVRHIIGLGFPRLISGSSPAAYPATMGRFVVDNNSAPIVKFQGLHVFGSNLMGYENRSTSKTMIFESGEGSILGRGTGDIFVTDFSGWIHMSTAGQNLWARQLNPEGSYVDGIVYNSGANVWILGRKSEGDGIMCKTINKGKTETLGFFYFGTGTDPLDTRPIFYTKDAECSFTTMREYTPQKQTTEVKITEIRSDTTRSLSLTNATDGFERWNCGMYSGFRGAPTSISDWHTPLVTPASRLTGATNLTVNAAGRVVPINKQARSRVSLNDPTMIPDGVYFDGTQAKNR